MKCVRKNIQVNRGCCQPRKSEAGYVLVWVLILMVVAALVMAPFLQFMLTGLRASYSSADAMHEFYAADSGIDDAIYKIQNDFTAAATLTDDIDEDETTLPVDSAAIFPIRGVVKIGGELIYYTSKTDDTFEGCTRGYDIINEEGTVITDTDSNTHDAGSSVVASLPEGAGDMWQYGLENINDKRVEVNVKNVWLLDGIEDPEHGTMPHRELVIVGNVVSTGNYQINTLYDGTKGNLKSDRIAVWMPAGVNYVPDSTRAVTTLRASIGTMDDTIHVESTALFASEGELSIDGELIRYTDKTDTEFHVFSRGYGGTDASAHSSGTGVTGSPVLANPLTETCRGGTVLFWDFQPLVNFNVGKVFPVQNSLSFQFTPTSAPKGAFSWVRTNRRYDIYLSWDQSCAIYKVTATVLTEATDVHTKLEAYMSRSQLYEEVSEIYGDYRAIGGSLMIDSSGPDDDKGHGGDKGVRDTLLSGGDVPLATIKGIDPTDVDPETGVPLDSIPTDATVQAAYLYWSAFRDTQEADDTAILRIAAGEDATVVFDDQLTADESAVLQNKDGGWSYACKKDVTSLVRTETTATFDLSTTVATDYVNITRNTDQDAKVKITADSDNLGDMTVDMAPYVIALGESVDFILDDDNPSITLTSGTTLDYDAPLPYQTAYRATIDCTRRSVTVGEVILDSLDDPIDRTLNSELDRDEVIITRSPDKSGEQAFVDIFALDSNPDDMTLDDDPIVPGETIESRWFCSGNSSDTLKSGLLPGNYQVVITCTQGAVTLCHASELSLLSDTAYPSGIGTYRVDGIEGVIDDEWSYAAWSLIVIYASPSEKAHHLYLYDDFRYVDNYADNFPDHYLEFPIEGFQTPPEARGVLTCFIGEGDNCYAGDDIQFQAQHDADWHYLYGGVNPKHNVWNGMSSGLGGEFIDGVDIDTFNVSDYMTEGDTWAKLHLDTEIDSWNLIYIILSLRTEPSHYSGLYPTGIVTYSYGGG